MSIPEALLNRTPSSIRNANLAIFFYGLVLVGNALAYAIRLGLWLGFVQSFAFFFVAILIGGSLVARKPKAWWVALVASWLVALRCVIGLLAWFQMRAEGRNPDVQRPIFFTVSLALSTLAIILLLSRDGRSYRNQAAALA